MAIASQKASFPQIDSGTFEYDKAMPAIYKKTAMPAYTIFIITPPSQAAANRPIS